MIRGPHLQLIARHSVRHSLRGGAGLIAILATLVIGLGLASVVVSPLEAVEKKMEQSHVDAAQAAQMTGEVGQEVIKIAKKAIGWAIGASDAQVDYLVGDKPALVSAILILLVVVTPLFACLAGFNQTSGDNASRGMRFLLIRTERTNIFLGRFIGTTIFNAVVLALLFAILAIYIAVKIHVHPTGDMMMWLAGGYVRILAFSLPYIALCAWISGAIDSPFGALMLCLTFAYVWPMFVAIGSKSNDAFGYAQYVTPWGFKWWLFSEQPAMVIGGIAVMLAFTAGLTWLGLDRFRKRDL